MDAQSQARAKPAGDHGRGPMKSIMRSIGKLKQAGFEENQTRAMAEFVEERVDGTVRPIVLNMDQRFGAADLWLNQIDFRFAQIDHRFDQIDHRFDRIEHWFDQIDWQLEQVNERLDRIEYRMKQGFEMLTGQIGMLTGQIQSLAGDVRRLQSRPWLPYLIIGLAFSGLYIAMLGILLAAVERMTG